MTGLIQTDNHLFSDHVAEDLVTVDDNPVECSLQNVGNVFKAIFSTQLPFCLLDQDVFEQTQGFCGKSFRDLGVIQGSVVISFT